MEQSKFSKRTRREFLQACLVFSPLFIYGIGGKGEAKAQRALLQPTPVCTDDDEVTPTQTEGPFYKRHSPERSSLLEPGITGTKIILSGYVLSRSCKPLPHVLLDFWHADAQGHYDNTGYRLRGHQFTDDSGRYYLETVVPGLYPGRTRHFHVKVQAPYQSVLTTQLYFPGEAHNKRDWLFNPALLMQVQDTKHGKVAAFNFVLDIPEGA